MFCLSLTLCPLLLVVGALEVGAAEDEGGEGVEVRQEDGRLHHLGGGQAERHRAVGRGRQLLPG